MSWEELRTALSSLRAMNQAELKGLFLSALDSSFDRDLQPGPILRDVDIVSSCLRILKKLHSQEFPWQYRRVSSHANDTAQFLHVLGGLLGFGVVF
jgi:hypothetical protein